MNERHTQRNKSREEMISSLDFAFCSIGKLKFVAPLGCGVTLTPYPPSPQGEGGKIGGYRPCDLVWGFAPNPVYIDVCGQSYQNVLIYDCRGRQAVREDCGTLQGMSPDAPHKLPHFFDSATRRQISI